MFLTELDVINEMLASMGEAPLSELDEDHDLVASGLRALRIASYREQSKAWWFNRERVTLYPDAQRNLKVPNDTIRVDPSDTANKIVQRGARMYDPNRGSFQFEKPVDCLLVRHIPFADLPAPAQLCISLSAQVDFQKSYDADAQKYQQLRLDYRDALMQLNAEHIRNQGANLLRRPSIMGLMQDIGPSFPAGGGLDTTSSYTPTPTSTPPDDEELGVPLVDFASVFQQAYEGD